MLIENNFYDSLHLDGCLLQLWLILMSVLAVLELLSDFAGIDGEQAAQAISNDHADSSKKIG